MSVGTFDTNVFVNCPFDKDYDPILQAILFCLYYLDFNPRIARERSDSGESRLAKICELIEASKFSIHDLSRCQAAREGEHYRLNMTFELGVDYGCRRYGGDILSEKQILILEEQPFRYQAAISDIAGFDIEPHAADFRIAVRKVRNWLVGAVGTEAAGSAAILAAYYDFQAWHLERQIAAGFSDHDIADYATPELMAAMKTWVSSGRPTV